MGANMNRRNFLLCGPAAAIVGWTGLVWVESLDPGYDPVGQTISELLIPGRVTQLPMAVVFIACNGLIVLFGYGLRNVPGAAVCWWRLGDARKAAGVRLGLIGPVAALLLFCPMDLHKPPATVSGWLHLFLAGTMAGLANAAVCLAGYWAGRQPRLRSFARVSAATAVILTALGALTVGASYSAYFGLAERLFIGTFLGWVAGAGPWLATGSHVSWPSPDEGQHRKRLLKPG